MCIILYCKIGSQPFIYNSNIKLIFKVWTLCQPLFSQKGEILITAYFRRNFFLRIISFFFFCDWYLWQKKTVSTCRYRFLSWIKGSGFWLNWTGPVKKTRGKCVLKYEETQVQNEISKIQSEMYKNNFQSWTIFEHWPLSVNPHTSDLKQYSFNDNNYL